MILRKNRSVLAVFVSFAVLALSASVQPAMACGDIQDWVVKYQHPDATDEDREKSLRQMAGPCRGYVAVTTDEYLLEILQDAIRRPYDKTLAQAVFSRYRCIPGVAEEEAYAELEDALDTTGCPSGYDRQNWFVVAVTGAFLRARSTKHSKRVGFLRRGVVVEKLGESGNWLKVKTWQNKTGFIHQDLLAIY
jgi:hypothetical protein